MPRGIKTAVPAAPKKRGPKPRAEVLAAAAVVVAAQAAAAPEPPVLPVVASASPAAAAPVAELPRGPGFGDSLKRGQRIDTMNEAELRAYARTIGISPRDCDGLSVERLRQNCTAHLYELIDAL